LKFDWTVKNIPKQVKFEEGKDEDKEKETDYKEKLKALFG
jgi:hypothetical protein